MVVKVIVDISRTDGTFPKYMTEGASGMDLVANEDVVIEPHTWALVGTGLYLEIPEGYEGQIRPRSGLALKYGLTVLNTPGTIDSDYRGEVKVILVNFGNDVVTINKGDRIAQLVFAKVEKVKLVPELGSSFTVRGDGGFGSTS